LPIKSNLEPLALGAATTSSGSISANNPAGVFRFKSSSRSNFSLALSDNRTFTDLASSNQTPSLTGTAIGQFTSFSISDAANDGSAYRVFDGGALRFSYGLAGTAPIGSVRLEAVVSQP
jgi:hypothetical protein